MRHLTLLAAVAALAVPAVASADSATVTVAGSANPFLAGQPDGTSCCGGDSAPDQSPTPAASGAQLTAGHILTFSATGGVNYGGGAPAGGADGDNDGTAYTYRFSMTADYGTGIAGAYAVNVDGLVGVFVNGTPSGAAPTPRDFAGSGDSTGLDFASLSPDLNQIFWIGDGLTGIGYGAVQQFVIPVNATALYLGTVDGSGWSNNSGSLSVTVDGLSPAPTPGGVPEPAAWALMLVGFGAMGASLRRRRSFATA